MSMTFILYGSAFVLLMVSYGKDKNKTKKAVLKALKSFENIMPQFMGIIFIIGVTLAILEPEVISSILGESSGVLGVLLASVIGSITMMPTFVAFSTADMLLRNGAGYSQVAAMVSTLTLVGVVTFTLESKYIGKKAAFFRNFIAFIFSFIVAAIIGTVLGG